MRAVVARPPEEAPALPDCPVVERPVLPEWDPRALQPLLDHLRSGHAVTQPMRFPLGTLLPDGRLDLCKQGLGVEGAEAVLRALRESPHVSSLLLGTNGIGDLGTAAVAGLVQHNPHIRTIYLDCNLIGPEGAHRLADAVRGSASVEALAELLRANPVLRYVDLRHSGIPPRGSRPRGRGPRGGTGASGPG